MSTEQRVLTSEEHEALMTGLRGESADRIAGPEKRGTRGPRQIKNYDFRRPEKFSRDQLRTLRGIHDQLIRLLNSSLAAHLRTNVDMTLTAVEQVSYEEFTAQTQEGNLIYIVQLDPLPAPVLMEVGTPLVFASLDRLLGGMGRRLEREREPTEIEKALFRENWLGPVLDAVTTAWQTIITLTPSVTGVETNAGFVHIALPSDVVVEVLLDATIGDAQAPVRLCYTYATLEPIIPQLDTQRLIAQGVARRRQDDGARVRRGLDHITVPLVAQLGTAEVTVEELLGLRQGDVIRLDTLVDHEIDVLVNGELKYHARPGLKRHRLAARITATVETGDAELTQEQQQMGGANGSV